MSTTRFNPVVDTARPAISPDAAARLIDAICQAAIDGRAAGRSLAQWASRFQFGESEFQVLWRLHLASANGLDQTALATTLALSPAQISATVERVRAGGWIAQHTPTGHRRRNVWQLTHAGRSLVNQMVRTAEELQQVESIRWCAIAAEPQREAA